jgi:hypothetical protein
MPNTISNPVIRHVLNLWTLVWHPSKKKEWKLERKLEEVKLAGFDGFMDQLTPAHANRAERLGLLRVGFFRASSARGIRLQLQQQRDCGAVHVNVHLGQHDTPLGDSLKMACQLMSDGGKLGVKPSIEVHRDTSTETPEKTYALAEAYERETGELLPLTWDFSHLAVVKHLQPPFWDRLMVRGDLLQNSQQIHFRPFNGHHCQVPVTNGSGRFTPEYLDYLPFMEKLIETWLAGATPGRELIAVPELGPLWLGYGLHAFPPSWGETQILRSEVDATWRRTLRSWTTSRSKKTLNLKVKNKKRI